MTAMERVQRARATLAAGAIVESVAWGVTTVLGILTGLSFATLVVPDLGGAYWHIASALPAGIAVMVVMLWRARHVASLERVALWIEERLPSLQYSLVTAVSESEFPYRDRVESSIASQPVARVAGRAAGLRTGKAVAAAAAGALLLYISPSPAFGGGTLFPGVSGILPGITAEARNPLENLTVEVTPPPYTGNRAVTLDDPSSIRALAGSRISVRGRGEAAQVSAAVSSARVRVSATRAGWVAHLIMPLKPAALTLDASAVERIIVLESRPDNAPRVTLTSPRRDSTLRIPNIVLQLEAAATDDLGLGSGYFEYLISSGSGEVFSGRTVTTQPVGFRGTRGALSARLDFSTLGLKQGDVVSIRAIVNDRNTLSGPGLGTSDTRTYRVARADEYDSVSVDAAAPLPVDSSAMSQRMLIQMTEQLVREQNRIKRQELVRRSTEIGDLEDRIRKRVHEILYDQDHGDEAEEPAPGAAPVDEDHDHSDEAVPIHNRDLLEAYNALWEAVRSLQIAEPEPALPPMRVALRALDRARLANRLYLRGLPPKVIVDLARVRMTGKEKGSTSTRTPMGPADSARARLAQRFEGALDLLDSNAAEAVRELTMLQVEALTLAPSFAGALGEALESFRRQRDATLPLSRARRALYGEPRSSPGLSDWSGTP